MKQRNVAISSPYVARDVSMTLNAVGQASARWGGHSGSTSRSHDHWSLNWALAAGLCESVLISRPVLKGGSVAMRWMDSAGRARRMGRLSPW